jgi:hypothetical protein
MLTKRHTPLIFKGLALKIVIYLSFVIAFQPVCDVTLNQPQVQHLQQTIRNQTQKLINMVVG